MIALPLLLPLGLISLEPEGEADSPFLTRLLLPGSMTILQMRGQSVAQINWRSSIEERHIATVVFFMDKVPPFRGTHYNSREF